MSSAPIAIRLRNKVIHGFTYCIIGLVRILPEHSAYAMGAGLAMLAWTLIPSWRRTAVRNLEIFYALYPAGRADKWRRMIKNPDGSEEPATQARLSEIARQSARNLGYHVIEFIRMGLQPREASLAMVVEADGSEHYDRAVERGQGAIAMSMHYGNWEVAGAHLASITMLYAVGKEQRDDFFTRLAFPWREKFGIQNIYAGNKVNSAVLRTLKNNCTLGLIADQNGGRAGHFIPFAGVLASTVHGPAVLAMRTGAPLLLTHCRRISPGRFKFIVKPPLSLEGVPGYDSAAGTFTPESTAEVLRRMNNAYEEVIREDPTQWLWGHKRWKTRPQGESTLY